MTTLRPSQKFLESIANGTPIPASSEQARVAIGQRLMEIGYTLIPVGPGEYARKDPATCVIKFDDGTWDISFRKSHFVDYPEVWGGPSGEKAILDELAQIFDYTE